jgi:hypothetical protein
MMLISSSKKRLTSLFLVRVVPVYNIFLQVAVGIDFIKRDSSSKIRMYMHGYVHT